MKRLKLLGMLLALAALLAAAVVWGSPYAPVVAPAGDIEEIWAIEDTREESWTPLVTALENHGVPLAYNSAENTFYCTLGLDNGDEWPDIHLTAPGADGVNLVFVDDYSYDWCSDAIRDAYSYELMAYTDTEYSYFYIVFTGLMQVSIETEQELSREDSPVQVTIGTAQGGLTSSARAHYRGGVTAQVEKHPYRVEFTRTADGRGKVIREVPVLGQMDQFVLIPMWYDNDFLRDRLSWMIYGELVGEDVPYGARRHSYAEVYVNGQYEGVYLLLEPYDHENEIAKLGAPHVQTDRLYASCPAWSIEDKPTIEAQGNPPYRFAVLRHMQGGDLFDGIRDYIDICLEPDDEVFVRRMMEQMDMDSMLRYHLLLQSFGLGDNVYNNLFVWAVRGQGKTMYQFVPWDMDMSWGENDHIEWIREDYDGWMYFPSADRLLNLNPDNVRARWADMWRQMRESVLTRENIEEKLILMSDELNNSGAIVRNAQRWNKDHSVSDPFEIINYVEIRMELLDQTVEYIAGTDGDIPMLMYDDPEMESGQIYGFDGREKEESQFE
ncbi:MAG: CotH kinase family protein [Clostridia bacterium]|nr:CotH kinase family protein [Clostridia bacterium]